MAASSKTHWIFRHFTGDDIFSWESFPPFDGFYQNLQYDNLAQIQCVQNMIASGKKYWRYYTVLDYPYDSAGFGGLTDPKATWFNWLRDNVQFNGTASFKRERVGGEVGLFSPYSYGGVERRELIPWKEITGSLMQSMAQKMVDLAFTPVVGTTLPCQGLFLDQSWLDHDTWMYASTQQSGHGDTKGSLPGLNPLSYANSTTVYGTPADGYGDYRAAFQAFIAYLASRLSVANVNAYLLPNGEHRTLGGQTIQKPWYLENAWNNPIDGGGGGGGPRWTSASSAWLTDKRNILSLQTFGSLMNYDVGICNALTLWKANGGWIGFTNSDSTPQGLANAEQAYMDAAMIQGGAL